MAKITPEVAVVLLDMEMPGGHGLDALRKIRSHNAMVKVIMVSGREELDGAIAAMKLGAFDYLAKPMPAEHLVGTVTRAVQIQSLTARHLLAA
jgi:DNA-binding NtrC family response regulator